MTTFPRRVLTVAVLFVALSLVAPRAQARGSCSARGAQAAAQRYLDALTDRNAAWRIPLERDVVRVENGIPTAATAPELRLDLFLHLQLSVMQGVHNVVWTFQPEGRAGVINATYTTPVGLPGLIIAGSTIVEDFTVTSRCWIRHIDATFDVEPPYPSPPARTHPRP